MQKDFSYDETVRIYDTDAEGIVHYAGYYRFFTDALEQFALAKTSRIFPMLNDGVMFVAVESNAKYHAPARVGDMLRVSVTPRLISKKAMRFDFSITRDKSLLCEGYIVQVAVDSTKWKAVDIPNNIIEKFIQEKS